MSEAEIVLADLNDLGQQQAILDLLDEYSQEPVISGKPLAKDVRERLIGGLQQHPTTHVLLAYIGERAVGVAVCFLGFSTFAAKPLLNIHDIAVAAEHRGQGIGKQLLIAVEAQARRLGCCKLTLEVFEENSPARAAYRSAGFDHAGGAQSAMRCLFLAKAIS
ncbi:MAG: GNAT family N-acetyltransferase [Planctomycetota bacterium]